MSCVSVIMTMMTLMTMITIRMMMMMKRQVAVLHSEPRLVFNDLYRPI